MIAVRGQDGGGSCGERVIQEEKGERHTGEKPSRGRKNAVKGIRGFSLLRGARVRALGLALAVGLVKVGDTERAFGQVVGPQSPLSEPTGLMAGAVLGATGLMTEGALVGETGPSITLMLGYALSRSIGLYAAFGGAALSGGYEADPYVFSDAEAGARVVLGGPRRRVLVYFEAALHWLMVSFDDVSGWDFGGTSVLEDLAGRWAWRKDEVGDVWAGGRGVSGGVGLYFFPRKDLAVDVGLRLTTGVFRVVSAAGYREDTHVGAGASRLSLGLCWFGGR